VSDINEQFHTARLQRYYNKDHQPSYITLGDVVGGMNPCDVPKKYLAADTRLLSETRDAILKFFKGQRMEFDKWLFKNLRNKRHDFKILLDSNFPESVHPYIEDRLGSVDVAPKGVSKRAGAWDKQQEHNLVLIRNTGSALRATPQFADAAAPENNVSGAPVVVLCIKDSNENQIKQLLQTLDKVLLAGHLTSNVKEMRLDQTGFVTFYKDKEEADVKLFSESVAVFRTNRDNLELTF